MFLLNLTTYKLYKNIFGNNHVSRTAQQSYTINKFQLWLDSLNLITIANEYVMTLMTETWSLGHLKVKTMCGYMERCVLAVLTHRKDRIITHNKSHLKIPPVTNKITFSLSLHIYIYDIYMNVYVI